MSKQIRIIAALAAAAAAGWPLLDVAVAQNLPPAAPAKNLSEIKPLPGAPNLNPTSKGHTAHIMPTVQGARALAKARALAPLAGGPLVYHGGPIMRRATLYAIFWIPAALQNGGPTGMSVAYQNLQTRLLADYPGHGIDNNNTQYYEIIGSTTTYIQNAAGLSLASGLGGFFIDTSPYPASGCNDTATPRNCITDAQIQTEIQKVMPLAGWTGGPNKMFLLYTSSGEGSCFNSGGTSCAYVQYCAYHSNIGTSPPIIYANMPFGNLSVCQVAGTPSPNAPHASADAVMSIASHEISESITDPFGTAWFDSSGEENGDICNFIYGTNTWTSLALNDANQQWNGNFYELQEEFNQHAGGCTQVGP
ncbi:MAG: hypothetical protein M3Z96_08110 [Pseudomonadota bacterium]|nr:hypothetical protein [Pseudomonadota bacterium]